MSISGTGLFWFAVAVPAGVPVLVLAFQLLIATPGTPAGPPLPRKTELPVPWANCSPMLPEPAIPCNCRRPPASTILPVPKGEAELATANVPLLILVVPV